MLRIIIYFSLLVSLIATSAFSNEIKLAVDVNNSASGQAALDGWDMMHVNRDLWRSAESKMTRSGGGLLRVDGKMKPLVSDYARDYIGDHEKASEVQKFVRDGFFNKSGAGVTPTIIRGLVPNEPVRMWLYAWGGGNESGVTRFKFDLDNDGEWDDNLLGSGEGKVEVPSTRSVVPNVIAPKLTDKVEGFAVGDSEASDKTTLGVMQINFIAGDDGVVRISHDKVAGNGWLNGILVRQDIRADAASAMRTLPAETADEPTLYMRVTVWEPAPANFEQLNVRACLIAGRRSRANVQSPEQVKPFAGKPGGRTRWFKLPVTKEKVPYSGVTLYLEPSSNNEAIDEFESNLDRIVLGAELAVGTDPDEFDDVHRLSRIVSHGNGVPFYYTAGSLEGIPDRANWLRGHLESIYQALLDAGFESPIPIDPEKMRLGINLTNSRFGAGRYGVLTRDPEMYELYGEIFALAGYNIGTRGTMRELYDNHPHFHANMVEVAPESKDLPDDYLPEGVEVSEELDKKYRQQAENARDGDGLSPVWKKLGDEIGVPRWNESDRSRELLLQQAKIVTGDDPSKLGLTDWDELEPVTETDPAKVAPEDRLRYYITLRVRNIRAAESYAVESAAIEKHLGSNVLTEVNMLGPMYYGGYSARYWYRQTPDYFRMGELGAVDVLQVQGLNSAYAPGGPLTLALLSPKVTVQAASRNPRVEPEIMHFAPRTPPESWPHVVFSSVISGVYNIDWYRFGPRATGWEWFDTEEKMLGHARLAKKLEKIVPYLPQKDGSTEAQTAILWAESSDLWQRHPRSYSKSELRSNFFALRFSGIETDLLREYMIEQGELDKYKVLFASQRNVNRRVQQKIIDWVANGGTLVLTPGAMTHDAADRSTSIVADALEPAISWKYDDSQSQKSGEFSDFKEIGRIDWELANTTLKNIPVYYHTQEIKGETGSIALYHDEKQDSAAGRKLFYGDGAVIALGFFPGHSYAAGSARARSEKKVYQDEEEEETEDAVVQGAVRTGSPYWLEPNQKARKIIAGIAENAGVEPGTTVSKPTVDAGVKVSDKQALIMLANYRPELGRQVTVTTTLPERFREARAKNLDGDKVRLKWLDDNKVQFSVNLDKVQAIMIDL